MTEQSSLENGHDAGWADLGRIDGAHDDVEATQPVNEESGTGLRVLQLTSSRRSFFEQQVAALEDRGIDCETVAVPARDGRERGRGPREYLAFYLQTLGRGLEEFDLVHVHYGMLGPLALAQPTRPVILTLWGSDLMGPTWLAGMSRLSARLSDAVVVPSPSLAEHLDRPHEVLPFGVDTDLFRPIPQQTARDRLGWQTDTDERVVLFPYAPDRPVKNYPLAERVVDRIPNARLRTISGVPHERMPLYMNASDALLVTSDRESGPMVIREAVACNVPVVSRDVGFAADVVGEVSGSYIADSESDLTEALQAALEAGGSDGREIFRDLDPAGTARRLEGIYRRALDR